MLPAGCSGTTDRNSLLLEIIHDSPGIQFREIMRESRPKNGVPIHYLKKNSKKWDGQSHGNAKTNKILPAADFRRGIQGDQDAEKADVAGSFTCADGKWHIGIQGSCKTSGKSPSTVSTYLSQTVFDNLVEIKFMGLKKKYHIKMEDVLDRLAEDCLPGMLEKPSSGFEDVIKTC